MSALIDDIWAAIFTRYIKPHDYLTKLILATVCRTTHRIFLQLAGQYVNVYGREVYCSDMCKNAEMYAGHTRHGIVRTTRLLLPVGSVYTNCVGYHYVQFRFMGNVMFQAFFGCATDTTLGVVLQIHLSTRNYAVIYMYAPKNLTSQIKFIKDGVMISVEFDHYEDVAIILQIHYDDHKQTTVIAMWNTFLGLRDVVRFVELIYK